MRRALAALALASLLALVLAATAAACPRASLADVEGQVMCLVCGVPLNLADSPQATQERNFVTRLIDGCRSAAEIKAALVAQYGPRVLALPADRGFGAAAYVAPLLVLLLGAAAAAAAMRAWTTRRGAAAPVAVVQAPSGSDTRRLDAELRRWDG